MMIAAALLALPFANPATPSIDSHGAHSGDYYLHCTRLHLAGGRVLENAHLHVVDGKVESYGSGIDLPDGAVERRHAGDVTAGLVAASSSLGLPPGESFDSTRSLMPEARIRHGIDPSLSEFESALAQGVTTAVISPSSAGLIGGVTTVVKTHGARLVAGEAHLSVSFSGAALDRARRPTSFSGARAVLDGALAEADGTLAAALAGKLPVLLYASLPADVDRGLAFAARHGLKRGAIRAVRDAERSLDAIAASGWGVIVGPFVPGSSKRALDSAALLAGRNVPLGFALAGNVVDAPSSLRMTAALAVRAGMERQAALTALTDGAARLAGVADRVGALEPGRDADFVLWSGDPLDLSSRVVAVYVDGQLAHGGDQ